MVCQAADFKGRLVNRWGFSLRIGLIPALTWGEQTVWNRSVAATSWQCWAIIWCRYQADHFMVLWACPHIAPSFCFGDAHSEDPLQALLDLGSLWWVLDFPKDVMCDSTKCLFCYSNIGNKPSWALSETASKQLLLGLSLVADGLWTASRSWGSSAQRVGGGVSRMKLSSYVPRFEPAPQIWENKAFLLLLLHWHVVIQKLFAEWLIPFGEGASCKSDCGDQSA